MSEIRPIPKEEEELRAVKFLKKPKNTRRISPRYLEETIMGLEEELSRNKSEQLIKGGRIMGMGVFR